MWGYFWKRLEEEYGFGKAFLERVFQKAEEMWEKASPYPLEHDVINITVEDATFRATMPAFVFVAAVGEVVFELVYNMLEDTSKEMARRIMEEAKDAAVKEIKKDLSHAIILPKVCKKCGFHNPITAKYCSECGEPLE